MRLLLVEDDDDLAQALMQGLEQSAYTVARVADGPAAAQALRSGEFSIAIVDIGLPGRSGLEVLSEARQAGNQMPVLILTARDAPGEKVQGLDAGADDYLVKPFDFDELLARLRALRRRVSGRTQSRLESGPLVLDPTAVQAYWHEQPVSLSRREFMLLETLLENAGKVVPRHQLETDLYGWLDPVSSNAIEVHIHHLRKKFSDELIRTVRGIGYMLQPPGG